MSQHTTIIHLFDPLKTKIYKSYVLCKVPKDIARVIRDVYEKLTFKEKVKQSDLKILKQYFGENYMQKLVLTPPKIPKINSNSKFGAKELDENDNSEEDIEFITKLLEESEETKKDKKYSVEYIFNINVFPEDRFDELKEKIFAITNIPIQNQHLFYFNRTKQLKSIYKIYSNNRYNSGDVLDMNNVVDRIANIPIDKSLYENRQDLKVEGYDAITLCEDIAGMSSDISNIYCYDIMNSFVHNYTQVKYIREDKFQLQLLYWGHVFKYFPAITMDIFESMVKDKFNETIIQYPALNLNKEQLYEKYIMQTSLMYDINENSTSSKNIYYTINSAQVISQSPVYINLRNLFDLLETNPIIPTIKAYLKNGADKYMILKNHIKCGKITFPPINIMNEGIIIAISVYKEDQENYHSKTIHANSLNEQSRFLYLNVKADGTYVIRGIFMEEDSMNFERLEKLLYVHVNPIIRYINSFMKYTHSSNIKLNELNKIEFDSINISANWKKFISSEGYRELKKKLDKYYYSGIFIHKHSKIINTYEFGFKKSMHEFNLELLEKNIVAMEGRINNYYIYLTNPAIMEKWQQQYSSKPAKIVHRNSDLIIEIYNLKPNEIVIFKKYINYILTSLEKDVDIKNAEPIGGKKIKKLKEKDPELYNLRKYGSKKIYSILCQNHRQPVIVDKNNDEFNKAVKYWNFTFKRPEYYYCPNPKYPKMAFIVGEHPKKYCLPCCKKLEINKESRKNNINEECTNKHIYDGEDKALGEHILSYGKEINETRIGYLPKDFYKLGFDGFYIAGVKQNSGMISNLGIITTICFILDKKISEFYKDLKNYLLTSKYEFSNYLRGTILTYFDSKEDFIIAFKDLFIDAKIFSENLKKTIKWEEIIIELTYHIYAYNIYIIEDINNKYDGKYEYVESQSDSGNIVFYLPEYILAKMFNNQDTSTRGIIIYKRSNYIYPVVYGETEFTKIFTGNMIQKLNTIIKNYQLNEIDKMINYDLIVKFCKKHDKYKIVKKYINKSNLIYAVLLEITNKPSHFIYISVDYSNNILDNIEEDFKFIERLSYNLDIDDLQTFILNINNFINLSNEYRPLVIKFMLELNQKIIGIQFNGNLISYTNPTYKNITKNAKIGEASFGPDLINNTDTDIDINHNNSTSVYNISENFDFENKKIPIKILKYDISDINKNILNRQPPQEDPLMKIGTAYYNNYLYQLLIIEFMNYVNKFKNKHIRSIVIKKIRENKLKDLEKMISSVDYGSIVYLLEDQTLAGFEKEFNEKRFVFDNIIIDNILKAEDKKLDMIKTILNEIASEKEPPENIQFDNMFVICSKNEDSEYCDGKKLMIGKNFDIYAEMLLADISNVLILRYITSYNINSNFINFMNFKTRAQENIDIKHL